MIKKENKYLRYDYGGKIINFKYVLKYILLLVLEPFFYLICSIPYKVKGKKYNICFCTIFKDEAPYLKEWIDYHQLIGVEHFYLYNNNSTDNYKEVLDPYINEGSVTLIEWPDTPGQISAYKHWLSNFKAETNWVSFSDVDEFFCPLAEATLREWIIKYKKYPVLLVYWKIFGASSRIDHDSSKYVIEQYTSCSPKLNEIGKLFYNTEFEIDNKFIGISMHHHLEVKKYGITIPPINVFGHFVKWGINRGSTKEIDMQMNHYNTKALNCYINKHKKGDSAFDKSWRSFDRFIRIERACTEKDFKIQRFLLSLKLKQKRIDAESLF